MTENKPWAATDMLDGFITGAADTQKANEVLAHGQGERPTVAELSLWLGSTDCPEDAVTAVCDRLAVLLSYSVEPPLHLHDGVIVAEDVAISIGNLWDKYRGAVNAGTDVRWPSRTYPPFPTLRPGTWPSSIRTA